MLSAAAVMLLSAVLVHAQTRVSGDVVDASTGEPVAFASVFFAGTTVGTEADASGRFSLTTDNEGLWMLCCQMMGYRTQAVEVKPGRQTTLRFRLVPDERMLAAAVVKPDNARARALLDSIDAHRMHNSPELQTGYSCLVYNKTDMATGAAPNRIPLVVSEAMLKRVHSQRQDAETVEAVHMTGYAPDAEILAQFTGSTRPRVDFYSYSISLPGMDLPSPASIAGLLHYDYFIVDSTEVDGHKLLEVHYHPKKGNNAAAFDGRMQVDAEDYALCRVRASLRQGANLNWFRALSLDTEYRRDSQGRWFYGRERMFADLSLSLSDTTQPSLVAANRELEYIRHEFASGSPEIEQEAPVVVLPGALDHDEQWWDSARPEPLNERDLSIREAALKLERMKKFRVMYDLLRTAATGYLDLGKIALGPYHQLVSFDEIEGVRAQLGFRTTRALMDNDRFSGYLAWGFRDNCPKGGLTWEHMFRRDLDIKLIADAHYDLVQLGRESAGAAHAGLFSSVLSRQGSRRLCPESSFSLALENELPAGFQLNVDAALKRLYANEFVPMGEVKSVASNELHAQLSWCKDDKEIRGAFTRTSLYSLYPVLTLDLTGAVPGLRNGDVAFVRPVFNIDWTPNMGMVGSSDLHLSLGAIFGEVPYPYLHMPEGNPSYISDRAAFACLDYFEFAADRWAGFRWNHSFNGLLFGWIPLVRELRLREEFAFRTIYGGLSERNNPAKNAAAMAFPEGMKALGGAPYCEIGCGVSNILSLLRLDFSWRLTHRTETSRNFAFSAGLEFKF